MTDLARRQWREATHAWRVIYRRRSDYEHRREILIGYGRAVGTLRLRDEGGVDVIGDLTRRIETCEHQLAIATAVIGALVLRYTRGQMPGGFAAWVSYFDSAAHLPTAGLLAI